MSRTYSPRGVLRHLPLPLLRTFCDRRHVPLTLDWDAVPDGDVGPVYAAYLDLSADHRGQVEQMLTAVHALADPTGVRLLTEEAAYAGVPVPDPPADHGLPARALAHLLAHPAGFQRVWQVRHADRLPGRSWHAVAGLAGRTPDPSPGAAQALKRAIADYFRAEQGRGHRVSVEHYVRPTGEHYYFCYPDDYTQTLVGHNVYNALHRTPVRPTFEVVFAFDPAAGLLEVFAPGPKAVRAALRDAFCKAILGTVAPAEEPHRPAYELNRLLDLRVLPRDPAAGLTDARVARLRVALPNRRRVTFEADPDGTADDVFQMLDEQLPVPAYPRDRLNVTLAAFRLTYLNPDGAGVRSLTFEVTYPGGCSLKGEADDARRVLGEGCLRAWGLLGA